MADEKTFMVEGAQLIYRNFAGRAGQYNAEGDRGFTCVIPEGLAQRMLADGWNVKFKEPRTEEEGDEGFWHIPIAVGYKFKPPMITMLTTHNRTPVTQDMVEMLDDVDIRNVDIFCRGYDWEANGKTGTKAYLKTMFITIVEDPLQAKYDAMLAQQNGGE